MNSAIFIPILLVFIAGGMVAIQAPTNAILAKAGGSPILAALISFAVGTAALTVAWIGGLYGAIFVAVAAYAAPRIGLASLITIGIGGQIAMALWLDHLGALGLPREPINPGRLIGATLVLAGVVLVRRS